MTIGSVALAYAGLEIVAALARQWGVERAGGTTVWFEIDRPQGEDRLPIRR